MNPTVKRAIPIFLAMVAVLALVIGAFALGSRSSDDETNADDPGDSPTSAASTPETSTSAPSVEPTVAPPTPTLPTYRIGKTHSSIEFEVEVTVAKVEAVGLGDRGSPGEQETVEAYVETCVPDYASRPWDMDVFQFAAVTKSGRVIPVGTLLSGVREPTYPTFGRLQPGRCQEGWAQVVMGKGDARTVTSIEWQPEPGEPYAAWTIKQPLTLGSPDY